MSKLLDYTGLGHFLDKLKTLFVTDVGVNGNSLTYTKDGVTSDITIPYAAKTLSIPFGVTDDSSTREIYTATVNGITELRDGVCCILRNTKITSTSGFTLNINNLGAKKLYKANKAASEETYYFEKDTTYLLVFCESLDGWITGRLSDENDDVAAYNIFPYAANLKTKTRLGRYMICLTYDEEYVLPVNDTDNNQTTNKTMTTESFDPFGEVFFGYVGYSIAADNLARSLYIAHSACNLKYSFNITDSTFTINKSVYLVMSPLLDGKCKLHSDPLSQTLPTTEDGLVYKLLGVATSGYLIRLYLHKPCYYFKDGQIREWTNDSDKQDKLISGTNIKTINNSSLLGSGNISLNTAFEVRGTSFTPKAKDNVYRYSMVFQYSENLMVGSATSYSNTDSKELTTSDFDPFGGIYCNTDIVNDGENINGSNLFMQGYYDFRYAFKIIADPLVAGKAIYLKCEPLLDVNNNRTGRVRFASGQPIVQTLPITADGYVYIFLGWAGSTTYMFLCANHPVYEFKDGALRLWTNQEEHLAITSEEIDRDIIQVVTWEDPAFKLAVTSVSSSGYLSIAPGDFVEGEFILPQLDTITTLPNGFPGGYTTATAFISGDDLGKFTNITTVPNNAFYNCSNITSVVIPDKVTTIGSNAFYGCSSLETINFGENVSYIGGNAFINCTSLESVEFPSSLRTLDGSAFGGCSNLSEITLNEGLLTIGSSVFSGTNIASVVIPSTVTTIGSGCFNNSAFSLIDFGNTRATILSKASNVYFWNASGSTPTPTIVVPDSLVADWKADSGWSSLASLIVSYSEYHSND